VALRLWPLQVASLELAMKSFLFEIQSYENTQPQYS
jgi:hypothetical protein